MHGTFNPCEPGLSLVIITGVPYATDREPHEVIRDPGFGDYGSGD
jgi:hypothetical protein